MKRAFISFDYDNDSDLKTLLIGQSLHPDTDFEITDFSIKEAIAKDWQAKARTRIKGCDVVIVVCGVYTHLASGVSVEVTIAQEEDVPYFLLRGRSEKTCTKPTSALAGDEIYEWTWDNLKALVRGDR